MSQPQFTDAIALLKADHRHIDDLLVEFGKSRWPLRRQSVADRLCSALTIHMALEEEIFYPAFRGRIADEMLDRARAEDDGARLLIRLIEAANPRDDSYPAKVRVLSDSIRRHIGAKERFIHGLFARCRRAGVDLVALRDAMMARRRDLMAQGHFAGMAA
jgi:hemerythrin superfamily protein